MLSTIVLIQPRLNTTVLDSALIPVLGANSKIH